MPIFVSFLDVFKLIIDFPFYLYMILGISVKSLLQTLTRKPKDLNGETILVTGAASGIGQNVVWKLAERFPQARFVLWDINESGLENTAAKCLQHGALHVNTYVVNLSNRDEIFRTAESVRREVGPVSILFNNAGITSNQSFLDSDPDMDERILKINFLAYTHTIRAFLPDMVHSGKGHLVSTCSTFGITHCIPKFSSYVASKSALKGFLTALRMEMKEHPEKPDIKFTTIYPLVVETPMTKGIAKEKTRYQSAMPLPADWTAEKIVDGILNEKLEVMTPGFVKILELLYNVLSVDAFYVGQKFGYGMAHSPSPVNDKRSLG